ncbi:MAG: carboxypeptidase M32 [Acholeplasmataceae bacterium]|nr:carboxypeptidase M32 [Acholeplasmataceae bacterium]
MKQIYEQFKKEINAYKYALWLMGWDDETEAPKASKAYRTEQLEVLYTLVYKLEMDEKRLAAIDQLAKENLTGPFKREIELEKKGIDQLRKIPQAEYIAYQVLISKSSQIWAEAKKNSDFEAFLPTLEEIIVFQKKLIKYLETDTLKGYDVLLDMYEENMGIKEYDEFFKVLNEKLVPFVLKTAKVKQKFPSVLLKGSFNIEKQKQFNHRLADILSYDLKKGVIKESVHPFTSGVVSVDTRVTTAYREDLIDAAIFSTIHEMGHGIYEQQVNPEFDGSILSGGVSMGIHESQSRLFENMIGRSKAFWDTHYPALQQIFAKELKKVTAEQFHLYVNRVKRDFIRIEADELTYSLHIMIRYEIEKALFNGKLQPKDLPKTWNRLYKKYLGLTVKNDAFGVLQDIHWSIGSFGYFPTYALGSAYAAQIYDVMNQEIDVEQCIKNNDICKINRWLKEHIHQYGKLKTPKEIILNATNKPFDPNYYVDYLVKKYTTIFKAYEVN